ncbi:MAG: peptidoglycan-binding protein [Oscillospiraceae bacterium]|jgi:peptidoglycan hydrolase-like protein with peptidoglycan-binding domain|nr:peptidoglycan-binding protein [Oscillospiraceae bacterium]
MPVIPARITVHLGSPKTNARNITVAFIDYIKNVACSEVYPTWPENALRANIYVIISFALNRVYTEFYRAQGYPFDITSSTSYDQAFVEGRDIFANISRLVEEQFNDYIVRRGQIQPMHSSYCNGTTAKCAGLSQWGSYSLATQGYTPYRILQYYYGSDIDLVFNAPVANVRPSYPGRLLRRGSIGEEVRTLQRMLRRVAQSFPAIPLTSVNTGLFDGTTQAAVQGFQRVFGLTVDGIVGYETWNRLLSIYNAVKRLSELDSEGISATEARELYGINLRQGDRGQDVRVIQYYLDFISLFLPGLERVSADGIFGQDTDRAVRAFQRTYGLTPDGIVGRETWNTLQAVYGQLYASLSASAARPFYPGYALSSGDTGEKVRLLQTWLNALSRQAPSLPALTPDGVYGPATQQAVAAFQQYAQVPVSGSVGPLTWNALAGRELLRAQNESGQG